MNCCIFFTIRSISTGNADADGAGAAGAADAGRAADTGANATASADAGRCASFKLIINAACSSLSSCCA